VEVLDQHISDRFAAYNADCVEFTAEMPDNSVDISVYSPPFSSLYIYSESERDMGNVGSDEEFQAFYKVLLKDLHRVTKPGRLSCVHVKDLVYYSNASEDGSRGLRDFTGACIQSHMEAGWAFHSRVTIWRCPVKEMTKSKPDGLLYKNFRTDSGRNRVGLPEYILVFRKWAEGMDENPINHVPGLWPEWAGDGAAFVNRRVPNHDGLPDPLKLTDAKMRSDPRYAEALDIWQQWASPVWMDTRQTDVLNAQIARDDEAERHLCPMPLDLTDRCLRLWSNTNDVCFSPFMGVGSEGFAALRAGRRFVGTELKPAYYRQAVKNLLEMEAQSSGPSLLSLAGVA